jgi:hypothetical protein
MSTTKNKLAAERFAKNVLFIINVEKSSANNYGFADISKFSYYAG